MHIRYIATAFAPDIASTLPVGPHLTVTWSDLVWAGITAGKPALSYLTAHGWHSSAERIVRSHTIYASLRQYHGYCERSTLYGSLDPSEKSATSYFLGMCLAKLCAARLFDTPWLFHVSMATTAGATVKFKSGTKSQPDLIGLNKSGDWMVVEAKGRTNGFDAAALTKAKQQTRMIRAINGAPPWLRVALQTYFDPGLSVRMEDPDDIDSDALDLEVDLADSLRRYYARVAEISLQTTNIRKIRGRSYAAHFDAESGITIGLDTAILDRLSKPLAQDQGLSELILSETTVLSNEPADPQKLIDGGSTYPDGLLVQLDARWSERLMMRDPEYR